MRRFLLRTERMRTTVRTKEKVLWRLQREKGRIGTAGSGLFPLRLVRSKLSAIMVIVGLGIVAVCDIAESNCTFDVFPGENSLVFPFHEDLNIRRWHGEDGGREMVICGLRRRLWGSDRSGRCQPPLKTRPGCLNYMRRKEDCCRCQPGHSRD